MELEKQFFDTFGIEERCILERYCNDCKNCACYHYPLITPEILLELICILATHLKNIECCHLVIAENIETLKRHTLNDCIDYAKDIKHQVRTLFEEG